VESLASQLDKQELCSTSGDEHVADDASDFADAGPVPCFSIFGLTVQQSEEDRKAAEKLVDFKSLPAHLSAACLVLHCLSTESSLRCAFHMLLR
jgi:hypothetical protein